MVEGRHLPVSWFCLNSVLHLITWWNRGAFAPVPLRRGQSKTIPIYSTLAGATNAINSDRTGTALSGGSASLATVVGYDYVTCSYANHR